MHFSLSFIALVAPILVSAAPWRRAASEDVTVLIFADLLEQLETQFYSEALAKFQMTDFVAAGFQNAQVPMQQLTQIGSDEATHASALQSAIKANGGTAITNCKFDFSSALTDVSTMITTARIVEYVGVSAYLGASSVVSDKDLLVTAAEILTVEARHQTLINIMSGATAISQPFDMALLPPAVLAIAGGFISGCTVPITANPSLTVTNTGSINAGTQLNFKSSAINGSMPTSSMFCQMLVGGAATSISLPFEQCIVPSGINGAVIIYITSDSQPLASNVVQQATTQLVAGPTMTFIDSQPDGLAQMVRNAGSSGSSGSNNSSGTYALSTNATGSGRNNATGPSPDGSVIVNGWTTVPSTNFTSM